MRSLTDEPGIARQHFGFLELLGRRLREDAYGVEGTRLEPLADRFPGLEQLFDSLGAASPTAKKVPERKIEDWNPFAQRVLLSDETPLASSIFEGEFSRLASYVQSFVEWAHEAVHILAVEPWLVGWCPVTSAEQFVRWQLASEGLAFWYADIVVTREIRTAVPEAELIYSRQSVSNTCFHPEQAFRRIGIDDTQALLPVYVAAFLGEDTPLAAHAHPYTKALAQRLQEFYAGTSSTLSSLYVVLEEFHFFREFYPRYCAIPGLPCLFDAGSFDGPWEVHAYHERLGTTGLPGLAGLPAERIARVRVRRQVQTRAYYAWWLRRALIERWLFGSAELRLDGLDEAIGLYLDQLEQLLRGPVVDGLVDDAMARLRECDLAFDERVRQPLARGDAHVKYRYRLYPYFAPTGGIVGLADNRSNYSLDDMLEVAAFVMQGCGCEPTLVHRLNRFYEQAASSDDLQRVRLAFNDFMTHPSALASWSVRADAIDPVHNNFRELTFEYT